MCLSTENIWKASEFVNYVFDIDGTICTDSKGDYESAEPIMERIQRVNKLFEEGNRIILFTARGMGSSNNDVEFAIKMWDAITREQLAGWGVKYHKLFLGKPAGDVYVDDKAICDLDFFKN